MRKKGEVRKNRRDDGCRERDRAKKSGKEERREKLLQRSAKEKTTHSGTGEEVGLAGEKSVVFVSL